MKLDSPASPPRSLMSPSYHPTEFDYVERKSPDPPVAAQRASTGRKGVQPVGCPVKDGPRTIKADGNQSAPPKGRAGQAAKKVWVPKTKPPPPIKTVFDENGRALGPDDDRKASALTLAAVAHPRYGRKCKHCKKMDPDHRAMNCSLNPLKCNDCKVICRSKQDRHTHACDPDRLTAIALGLDPNEPHSPFLAVPPREGRVTDAGVFAPTARPLPDGRRPADHPGLDNGQRLLVGAPHPNARHPNGQPAVPELGAHKAGDVKREGEHKGVREGAIGGIQIADTRVGAAITIPAGEPDAAPARLQRVGRGGGQQPDHAEARVNNEIVERGRERRVDDPTRPTYLRKPARLDDRGQPLFEHEMRCAKRDLPPWATDLDLTWSGGDHEHAILALARKYLEWRAYSKVNQKRPGAAVMSMAGTEREEATARDHGITNWHACAPCLLDSDHFRDKPIGYCGQLGPCDHMHPDVIIGVHVYEPDADWVRRTAAKYPRATILFIHHVFIGASGTYYDEAKWSRHVVNDKPMIEMQVEGGKVYWNPDRWTEFNQAESGLTTDIWVTLGNCVLYEVKPTRRPTPVEYSLKSSHTALFKRHGRWIYNSGDQFAILTADDPIVVPKTLYNQAATTALTMASDLAGRVGVIKAVQYKLGNPQYAHVTPDAVAIIADLAIAEAPSTLGNSYAIAAESRDDPTAHEAMAMIAAGNNPWWLHTGLRRYMLGHRQRWETWIARKKYINFGVALIAILAVFLAFAWNRAQPRPTTLRYGICYSENRLEDSYFDMPTYDQWAGCVDGVGRSINAGWKRLIGGIGAPQILPLLGGLLEEVSVLHYGAKGRAAIALVHLFVHPWREWAFVMHWLFHLDPLLGALLHLAMNACGANLNTAAIPAIAIFSGCYAYARERATEPLNDIAFGDQLVNETHDHVDRGPGPEPIGLAFPPGPVVTALEPANEEIALRNRLLVPVTVGDAPGFYDHCVKLLESQRQSVLGPVTEEIEQEWMERMPTAVQRDLCAAKELIIRVGGRLDHKRLFRRKAFLKYEKLLKEKRVDGVEPYAPRLIEGCTPEYNMLVGPWIYQLAKCIKADFSPTRGMPYAWGSGATCADLAQWFQAVSTDRYRIMVVGDDSVERIDGEWAETDFARYDGRMSWYVLQLIDALVTVYNLPKHIAWYIKMSFVTHFGVTRFGWKYDTTARQISGSPFTALLNALYNLAVSSYCYVFKCDPALFGLEAKTKRGLHAEQVGFLSGHFYVCDPYVHNGHVLTCMWGPSATRQLPKVGWDINFQRAPALKRTQLFYGEMLGHADWDNVPILGEYRALMLRSLVGVKPRYDARLKREIQHKPGQTVHWAPNDATRGQALNLFPVGWLKIADQLASIASVKMPLTAPWRL